MERQLDHDIESIRDLILRMGGQVEAMISRANSALLTSNAEQARRVVSDDHEVDRLEKEIDEKSLSVIARFQPAASDLRFLASGMKVANDLERMGDSAV